MSFSPPAAGEAATVWLLRGHTTDDDRAPVVVIFQGSRRSTSIGIVIVRRRAAHIVQIVKDGQFYPALSAGGCITTSSSGMSAFVALPTALLVVVRVLPPFLLALLLLLAAAPPPIVTVLVMRPLVISAASPTGQSAISACQVVRHDTTQYANDNARNTEHIMCRRIFASKYVYVRIAVWPSCVRSRDRERLFCFVLFCLHLLLIDCIAHCPSLHSHRQHRR